MEWSGPRLKPDVHIVPHHQTDGSMSEQFVDVQILPFHGAQPRDLEALLEELALLGPYAARLVTTILYLSIAGAMSAMVWAGPRVYYAMAKDGLIPSYFCSTSGARGIPINAILLQSLWASVLIVLGSFERLVIYSGTVLTIFSGLAVGAVVVLRQREPDLPRPCRTPLYPFVPYFFMLMSIVIVWNALYERPMEGAMGIVTVLAGAPLYLLWRRLENGRGSLPHG